MQIKQVNFEFKQKNGDNIVKYEIIDAEGKVVFENWNTVTITRKDGERKGSVYLNITESPVEQKLEYVNCLIGELFVGATSLFFSQYFLESWHNLIGLKFSDIKISTCKNKFEFTNPKTKGD